jgi:hypothetical protein
MTQLPIYCINAIRQRKGLEEDDTSKDDEILLMTPMDRLRDVCGWYLGDSTWADAFVDWARDCGMEVME